MLIWFPGKLLRERWGSASNRIGFGQSASLSVTSLACAGVNVNLQVFAC
jgi:hypothetical protein